MTRQQAPFLRVVIIAVVLVGVFTQFVVLPGIASGYAAEFPELEHLARPYVLTLGAALLGLLVALIAAWQLVSMASQGQRHTEGWNRWVTVLAAGVGWWAAIVAGLCVHAGFFVNVGGPPILLGLIVSLAILAGSVIFWRRARLRVASVSERAQRPASQDSVSA